LGWRREADGIQTGHYAPTNEAIKNRARAARRWLKERSEKEIVVVTHGGFLHYFTEDWEDSSHYQGKSYPVFLDFVDCCD
jgi:broad specificity phosphatase PhoE